MARLARLVIPGEAHHVTQRGNRRERVFFEDSDYRVYRSLVAQAARASGVAVWAYCLMPNHVHFVMVPRDEDGLRGAFAEAHRRYTARINSRHQWTGHLWQGRFSSVVMDEAHLWAAVRYVTLNPVRAGLVTRAADWPWSSAQAHLAGRDDEILTAGPILERVGDFTAYLAEADDAEAIAALKRSYATGRPVGGKEWLSALEARTGRNLAPRKRGPKPGVFRGQFT